MGALKVVGGILSLVAGVLVLLVVLTVLGVPILMTPYVIALYIPVHAIEPMATYMNLIIACLAIIGGILGLAGKKAGGGLALAAALIWMIGGILLGYTMLLLLNPMSFFVGIAGISIWLFSIESLICLVGGILILASGSD